MNNGPRILTDEADIRRLFESKNIRYDRWGQNGSESFEALMRYIVEDQVWIEDIGGTPLVRVKNVVAFVLSMRTPMEELYEACQIRGQSPPKIRPFRGISETLTKGEDLQRGAERLMAEEPGYSEKGFCDPRNYRLIPLGHVPLGPQPSEKWPGIDATFSRFCYQCEILNQALYNPEGYYEIRDGVKTILKWKPA